MNVWTIGYLDRYEDNLQVFYTEDEAYKHIAANSVRDWIEDILADESDDIEVLNNIKHTIKLLKQERYKEAVIIFSEQNDEKVFVIERTINTDVVAEAHMLSNLNDAFDLVESQIKELLLDQVKDNG